MFDRVIYVRRREKLRKTLQGVGGVLLFLGNDESPMNYRANAYHFRQDSTFLYYWGVDHPGLSATLDLDSGAETLFGDDPTVADIVWTGPQPLLREKAEWAGVAFSGPRTAVYGALEGVRKSARRVHFLPPYRGGNMLRLAVLTGIRPSFMQSYASVPFVKAVVNQRAIKAPEEVAEIEKAVATTVEMQLHGMRTTRAGMIEREVSGGLHAIAIARGGNVSFPPIFTVHGETLHNLAPNHVMQDGQMVVNDCGAETALHYAGDLTRTFPVSGKFTPRQRDLYNIVFESQRRALAAIKPGVLHRDVHRIACEALAEGLGSVGLMKGDPAEAFACGATAMFFQCGLGHMMGMDTHDMEDLGEQHVGYGELERDMTFGICYLRLARALEPGFVITCEPGIYIIPQLIDQWKAEHKHEAFINYAELEKFRDFGGIRIEDDLLVTESGYKIFGPPLAKTIEEVEAECLRG